MGGMADENDNLQPDEPGGSLADAIAEHLALKRDHGADPAEIEGELEDALSPPRRDEVEAAPAAEAAPEPEPEVAPEPAAKPEPEAAPEPAATADEPKPGEITGTIEFEFGDEQAEAPAEAAEQQDDHDLLEDTPDFFEETPEHDKLWFDEAPPRKFDF